MPSRRANETDHATCEQGVAWRVEELVVAASPVDDLCRYRNEREGGNDVSDLVIEWHRLEDVPEKAKPIQ
jgi:hypothetical protein